MNFSRYKLHPRTRKKFDHLSDEQKINLLLDDYDLPRDCYVYKNIITYYELEINCDSYVVKYFLQKFKEKPYKLLSYVSFINTKRNKEIEDLLLKSKDAHILYNYIALFRERWPEAEEYIKEDWVTAWLYVDNFVRGKWPEAEHTLKEDEFSWKEYKKLCRREKRRLLKNDQA